MKNLHLYFICIIVVPLTLGIVIVTLLEAYLIRAYFQLMINNLAD